MFALRMRDSFQGEKVTLYKEGVKMKIRPLNDRIIVERLEGETRTSGGIVLPDTAKEKPKQGRVVAVGAGRLEEGKRIPVEVKEGETILFGSYAGTEVKIDGKEYLILREEDVLGIVEEGTGKKSRGANA